MKLQVLTLNEKEYERRDYRQSLTIKIDGKRVFSVGDNEPEDSNLSRCFNDCYKVADLMKLAYEAGKRGEEFSVEEKEVEDTWEE